MGWPDQFRKWLDNMTDEDLTALKEYWHVNIDRRDVVQALRAELALYVPRWFTVSTVHATTNPTSSDTA